MRTNPVPASRRTISLAVAAAALLAPAAALASNKTFAANSLIIPSQVEYYPTGGGVVDAYGLIYTVLLKNGSLPTGCTRPITFYWAIAANKLSQYRCNSNRNALPDYSRINDDDGCDFVVQSADGVPVADLGSGGAEQSPFNVNLVAYTAASGPYKSASTFAVGRKTGCSSDAGADCPRTVMKYLGGAWIVDATDRQCFVSMLQNVAELAQYHKNGVADAHYVPIHSARASFTAPVARLMNQKPPVIAVVGPSSKAMNIENVLANAGLNAIANWNAGVVYEYHDATEALTSTSTNPWGVLNNGKFGMMWGVDGMTLSAGQVANLKAFLDGGYGIYVEANSIDAVENTSPLVTTTGITDDNPNIAYYDDCNDRTAGTTFFHSTQTGACFKYAALDQPWAQTGNYPFEGGQANYKGYHPNAAFATGVTLGLQFATTPPTTMAAARYKDNDLTKGLVIYLSGMSFDTGGRFWGERMILNSVLTNVPLLIGTELARSEPVGAVDATTGAKKVYQGTYVQMPDPTESSYVNYTVAAAQRWMFPYTPGHLYEYDLGNIPATTASFSCTTATGSCPKINWDAAAKMPAPTDRTLFTTVGGSAHLGWKRISFDYHQTHHECLDADGDGYCDLSRMLAQCNTAGVNLSNLQLANAADVTQADQLGMFVQQVRGHCAAHTPKLTGTPVMEPSNGQCDDYSRQKNVARLGGLDHGSPVVVGPSPNVNDANFSKRPTVAYAGARDGMLHAFFVSGGSGFSSPSGTGLPSGVTAGRELWAYLPPGQLCGLATNNGMVDATLNVVDALAAFPTDANHDGVIDWTDASERPTGVRSWRTVLIGSVGAGGSELFALDVTDPLAPVLLWHLSGASENDGRFDVDGNGTFDASETFDKASYKTYALKWFDWDDGSATTDYIPTDYNATDADYLDELKTGRYDYHNLGSALGTAVGKIGNGNAFQYVVFTATNIVDFTPGSTAPPGGFRGIEVFATDLVTGQKLWQWERRYQRVNGNGTPIADNEMPGRVALVDVDSDGVLDRVYVGDLEGHLWELAAATGKNLNYLPDDRSAPLWHSLPLFGTRDMAATDATAETKASFQVGTTSKLAQQPLTTPIAIGKLSIVPKDYDKYLLGRIAIAQGTMGVDWSIAPYEDGSVYVLPVAPADLTARVALPGGTVPAADLAKLALYGVLKQATDTDPGPAWRIGLKVGERVFGMPRFTGTGLVFNTAFGAFSGDLTSTAWESGNLYAVGTDATTRQATTSITSNQSKAFGGVLVLGTKLVITTDTSISTKDAPATLDPGNPSQLPFDRYTPAIFRSWEPAEVGR